MADIEDLDVTDYLEEVDGLIDEYKQKLESSEKSVDESEATFFEIGKKLHQLNLNLIDEDSGKKQKVAKKKFTKLKENVATKIGKNRNNIDKVVKVAKFVETDDYKTHKKRLPSSWGTLYLVSGLKEKQLETLMSDKEVGNTITRDALAEKIKKIKGEGKTQNHRVTIVIEGGAEATKEQLLQLQKYLKREFKVWVISSPNFEQDENTSQAS
jgi:hypothetical protein